MSSTYTTIALTEEDKETLDRVNRISLDGNASYREVVNFLVDEHETEREQFDEVVLTALSRIDDSDVQRLIERRKNDAKWVEGLSGGD